MSPKWDDILNRIGAERPGWKLLSKEVSEAKTAFEKGEGISDTQLLQVKETWKSLYPFTDADGRHFVLYIYDHSTQHWRNKKHGFKKPKFHFCWCPTLQRMEVEGRRGRYKAKYDIENKGFEVTGGYSRKTELEVCINCLKHMSYKKYNSISYTQQQYIYSNFDLPIFFSEHDQQNLKDPTHQYHKHQYTSNWPEISRKIKIERGGVCEREGCGSSQNLETHHVNGVKDDNRASNLVVLCHECHSKEPHHSHMRS